MRSSGMSENINVTMSCGRVNEAYIRASMNTPAPNSTMVSWTCPACFNASVPTGRVDERADGGDS
jgi:hypothetical protein